MPDDAKAKRPERCPWCGSSKWSHTLLCVQPGDTDHNKRACHDCGCMWRLIQEPGKRPNER